MSKINIESSFVNLQKEKRKLISCEISMRKRRYYYIKNIFSTIWNKMCEIIPYTLFYLFLIRKIRNIIIEKELRVRIICD